MVFTKMNGAGNDYVYVDCTKEELDNPSEVAIKVSDRHTGIGSDGLILIKSSDKADFFMEMYNADGSQGKMCGNGIVYLLHGMSGTYEDYRVLGARPTAQNIVYEYNRNDMILVSFTVFTDVDRKQESDYGFSDLTARYDACENDVINALIPYINSH